MLLETISEEQSIASSERAQPHKIPGESEIATEDLGSTANRYPSDSIRDTKADSHNSTSSTVRFEHESFTTFQYKVLELCADIFPTYSRQLFRLEQIKGGSYHRIVGLTITPPRPRKFCLAWLYSRIQAFFSTRTSGSPTKYIFRIPRDDKREPMEIEYDAAILRFAGDNLALPIPRIVHVEPGRMNAINSQYMIQERLPGQNLARTMLKPTADQLKCLVLHMINIHRELQRITSSTAGVVSPTTYIQTPPMLRIDKFSVSGRFSAPLYTPASPQTTLELLVGLCERWREYEQTTDDFVFPVWAKLEKVARHLHARGFIPDTDTFYLCHLDLMGRNILADIVDENTVEIKGLLDWDAEYVCFCPKFMAYRAPFWLWVEDEEYEEDERYANLPVKKPENAEAKRAFEELAGDEWLHFAYSPEYVLARRMFAVLKGGLFSSEAVKEAEDIVKGWRQLHPDDDVKGDDDSSLSSRSGS